MQKSFITKGVVCVIVILFIGLAFTSSSTGNSTNNEFVEITTVLCGMKSIQPQTVKLTHQESLEIKKILEDTIDKLDKAITIEETVTIINTAVEELESHGLLGSMSSNHIQKMIAIVYQKVLGLRILYQRDSRLKNTVARDSLNRFCLLATHITGLDYTEKGILVSMARTFGTFLFMLGAYSLIFQDFRILGFSSMIIGLLLVYYSLLKPLRWMNTIDVRSGVESLFSVGLLGIQRDTNISLIEGFTGIKIGFKYDRILRPNECFYLGFALDVS